MRGVPSLRRNWLFVFPAKWHIKCVQVHAWKPDTRTALRIEPHPILFPILVLPHLHHATLPIPILVPLLNVGREGSSTSTSVLEQLRQPSWRTSRHPHDPHPCTHASIKHAPHPCTGPHHGSSGLIRAREHHQSSYCNIAILLVIVLPTL